MQIQLLMTGSELMSGTTVDSNSARIADAFATLGMSIHRKVTVGDALHVLVTEIRAMAADSDVLLINGGLGPTRDDLTAEALALAAGDTLATNPTALQHLEQWCETRLIPLNTSNRKQACLPSSAFLIANPVGSAVGFGLDLNGCLVICTPGIPRELDIMLTDSILPLLQRRFPAHEPLHILRLHLFGIGESQAQDIIDQAIPDWPDEVTLGFRAGMPTVEVKLFANTPSLPAAQLQLEHLHRLFANDIVAHGDHSLPSALLDQLASNGKTLVTAESCTGGLIASHLTEVAGASRVFTAGFITYSNAMKTAMLGVHELTLENFGAVSEETVTEMAQGALERSGADYAVAVSGIAGPDGGTRDKPAGTVWIAWASLSGITEARCFQLGSHRKRCQQLAAAIALDGIRRLDSGIATPPRYFARWLKHT
jgi:nicotinamide-nucleotide amidase